VKESEGSEKGLGRELGIERVELGFLEEKSDDLGFKDKREEAEVVAEHAIGSVVVVAVCLDDGKKRNYEVEMKWVWVVWAKSLD
jgi:hypothetical protein